MNFSFKNSREILVVGIDEAGRGPLAGPVVAACVILDKRNYPLKLNDSKKLSKKNREEFFLELQNCAKIGIGIIDEKIIDEINILNATKLAMKEAFNNLCQKYNFTPSLALVDGNFIPRINCHARSIIKGDRKSVSIAAASIIAKVTRDKIMMKLHDEFPDYGWDENQAYPTKFHIEKVKELGFCKYHRKSFSPIKEIVNAC